MANGNFQIDYQKLEEMCECAYKAYFLRKGIFRHGLGQFIPRFNLPPELEQIPPQKKPIDAEAAANYLFLMDSMEKRSVTATNIKNGLRTWENPKTRWIFSPSEVSVYPLHFIDDVCSKNLQYRLANFAESYQTNCRKLVKEYDSHAVNVVAYNTVSQARTNLMEFQGIGTGIANLFITDVIERELAQIRDPKNALLKVDVHKGRLPINVLAIQTQKSRLRRSDLIERLEQAYWKVCEETGIDPCILDPILWIIGSKICAKRNYSRCVHFCPLEKMCQRNVFEDGKTSSYVLVDKNGNPIDKRKQKGQGHFFTEFD